MSKIVPIPVGQGADVRNDKLKPGSLGWTCWRVNSLVRSNILQGKTDCSAVRWRKENQTRKMLQLAEKSERGGCLWV
ncbi:hypothetical protein [Ensifer aridi]|uniref:hypothetical protein n=1 Tax=Ensifer aridi TaxID=1708715 RepID=UPI001FCCDBB4|nr:hypothetical protein [Ensifer aridi]